MQNDELEFIEEMVASTELLMCQYCQEQTLHTHQEVIDVLPVVTKLLMECTYCQTTQTWLDWNSPKLARNQS